MDIAGNYLSESDTKQLFNIIQYIDYMTNAPVSHESLRVRRGVTEENWKADQETREWLLVCTSLTKLKHSCIWCLRVPLSESLAAFSSWFSR